MSDNNDNSGNATLTAPKPLKLSLNRGADAGRVTQNIQQGRSKTVTVEVRKTRSFSRDESGKLVQVSRQAPAPAAAPEAAPAPTPVHDDAPSLTKSEMERRKRVLERANENKGADAQKREEERRQMDERQRRRVEEVDRKRDEEQRIALEAAAAASTALVEKPARQVDVTDAAIKNKHKRRIEDELEEGEDDALKKSAALKKKRSKVRGIDEDDDLPSYNLQKEEEEEYYIPRQALLEGDEFEDYSDDVIPDDGEDDIVAVAIPKANDKRDDVVRRVQSSSRVIMAAPDPNKIRKYLLSEAPVSPKRARRIDSMEAQPSAVASGDKKIGTNKRRRGHKPTVQEQNIVLDVTIPEQISVADLANRMAVRGVDVIKSLMKMGVMATPAQMIDADTAELIVSEFGHHPQRVTDADVEQELFGETEGSGTLKPRAPVVTVMGHVDHGKTSLLDRIRQTNVVSGEAGGITQHIGAYQVTVPSGQKITFLDTPGHAAFTAMRARGAKVTDVVILVVAADDGIMPQTVEAINHAKAAGVPIVVACNKMDKPDANPQRVRQELMQYELIGEEFGGDIMIIDVSAKAGTNIDALLDAVLLQAEVLDLKADYDAPARGVVIESRMDKGRGTVATLLMQNGTLKQGDLVVAGAAAGYVRAILNDRGEQLQEAGPALPVEVLGLDETPVAGELFAVAEDEKQARDITEYRKQKMKLQKTVDAPRITLDQLFTDGRAKVKELPLIVKADVHGSLEAIVGSLEKIESDEVKVRVVHSGVGAITESDIVLAKASNAVIIGFNVRANSQAKVLAEREKIDVQYFSIIYELIDNVKKALSGMLSPEFKEIMLGYAEIRQVFNITKVGKVAGAMVTQGLIKRNAKCRLLRDNVVIHEGSLKTLKRFKDDVKEVREGFECGIAFENYDDIRENDQVEAFELEQVTRSIT
ncbi:translation initiation factor IF-2 [bacterium]|nr:translation initiation factor IF-2 [bacterium]